MRIGRQGWSVSNSGQEPNRSNPRDDPAESLNDTIQPRDLSSVIQQPGPQDNTSNLDVPDEEFDGSAQLAAEKERKTRKLDLLDLSLISLSCWFRKNSRKNKIEDLATKTNVSKRIL